MNNERIIYRPYRIIGIVARIMIAFELIMIALSIFFVCAKEENAFSDVLWILLILSYCLLLPSKKMLVFDESGLYVVNEDSVKFKFIPWSSLSYVYCRRDYKGFRYLILSSNKLCEGQVKKYSEKVLFYQKYV